MNRCRSPIVPVLATLAVVCGGGAARAQESVVPTAEAPVSSPGPAETRRSIDVVFCVDCSGSMTMAMRPAKAKIAEIIDNIVAYAPNARLRVGLIRYGDGERNFRIFPLSDDLSSVLPNVAATNVEAGACVELVGLFVRKATQEMAWTPSDDALKLIYVVGNETAAQGMPPIDYRTTVPAAVKKNILVSAVYCRMSRSGWAGEPTWREVAQLGRGEYLEVEREGLSPQKPGFLALQSGRQRPATFSLTGATRAGGFPASLRSFQSPRRR